MCLIATNEYSWWLCVKLDDELDACREEASLTEDNEYS